MKCPKCGSDKLKRYASGIDCIACGHMGRAQDFGAKCTCCIPHHTPLWYCAAHGEVSVPMD